MVQAWDPFHPIFSSAWNGVCWSLSVEAFFYLLFPWIQTSIEKLSGSRLAVLGLLAGLSGILWAGPTFTSSERFAGIFSYVIIPIIHLPEFIAGIVLGNVFLNRSRVLAGGVLKGDATADRRLADEGQFLRNMPRLTLLGAVSSILIFATLRGRWTGLVIASFSLLLYGLAAERSLLSRFLSMRVLILGGEISYAMYLLRTPVHNWINLVPALAANRAVSLLYIPLLLIPLSLFSYYVVEGPSRRGLRRFFAALQSRPT
jgi:peptidoglycan/LPS O-acetylase OafA/YrhL